MEMTAYDFAHKIGVAPKTVYVWVKNKTLPPGVSSRVHLRRLIIIDERKNIRNGQGKPSPVHEGKRGNT